MCGIAGIYGLADVNQATKIVASMNNSLAHRGPDDEGVFSHPSVVLGHRRLSIIDLSSQGHQPMYSVDQRYCIVFNGELYNFREIRSQLLKEDNRIVFKTNTDTEVILVAYAKWGKECLRYFNGMFAFALWDNQQKELFIARDRLGIKPLYYFKKDHLLIFASEIRAILSSEVVPRELNRNGLVDYCRYQTVHAPDTIIENVFMLMPGNYLFVSEHDFIIKEYWSITTSIKSSVESSYKEICNHVSNLFYKAVERRLIADVPFGAFLSGGIDSSAVVGAMTKVSNQPVKTFAITFDEKEFDESVYSNLIAKKFGTVHSEIKLSANDFKNELPQALKVMDHPSGDGPNTYLVSKVTKEAGITMALSGLGGDELFAGYPIFKRSERLQKWQMLSSLIRLIGGPLGGVLSVLKPGVATDKLKMLLESDSMAFEKLYPLSRQVLMENVIKNLMKKKELPENALYNILAPLASIDDYHLLSKISVAEITTYMQNVLLRDTDQMSMASALEVRVPFLDYELVECVLSVSDRFKYPHSPKKLLTDSLGDLLPSEIINRPKMGFTFPWKYWMKNDLKQFCQERIYSLSKRDYFVEQEIIDLWKKFLNDDKRITWSRIWPLVVLENWLIENHVS